MICVGDPDSTIVCKKESEFWDCEEMPNGDVKCGQKEPSTPDGTHTWNCVLKDGKLVCTTDTPDAGPDSSTPGGGGGWTCTSDDVSTTCEKEAPVPPGGGTYDCKLTSEFKVECTGDGGENPPPTTPPEQNPPPSTAPPGGGDRTCYEPEAGSEQTVVPPEGTWAEIVAKKVLYNGTPALYARVTFSKAFVDNTYGVNAFKYMNGQLKTTGHSFGDLVESDKAEVFFADKKGDLLFHIAVDYISKSESAPSGYACLGVNGGEGQMIKGDASDVLAAQSSLAVNFNGYGYVLTQDSPKTDETYKADPAYPKWIWEVWYEVWIKWSAFGESGPGRVYITGIHASPSKIGEKMLKVVPTPCP